MALAGCGGDDDSGGGDPGSQGPLAEFFGWDERASVGGDNEFSEEERQQHYEVQEYIVDCMSGAGFEYFPEPFWGDRDDVEDFDDPYEDAWQLREDDPEAFAREYGYAITTVDHDRPAEQAVSPDDDPNFEYRDGLSEAAQEEYDKALHGDWDELEEEDLEAGDEPVMPDPPGCQNEAWQEIAGFGGPEENEFADLQEEMQALEERIQDDARLAEAKQAWSSCMADAGHSGLTDLWDGQAEVQERQSELYDWGEGEAVEGEAVEDELEDSEIETTPPAPPEPDPDELEELREFELEIAWADYTCKQEHNVEQVEREVRFEMEEEFIENHREELEQYRDWIDEQGVG